MKTTSWIFGLLLFISCNSVPEPPPSPWRVGTLDDTLSTSNHKCFGDPEFASPYRLIRDDLYVDSFGNAYLKWYKMDYEIHEYLNLGKDLIDTATYHHYLYYPRDKNNVYYRRVTSDQIYFKSIDADVESFLGFEDCYYAVDKNKVYYRGGIVKNADLLTFRPLYHFTIDSNQIENKGTFFAVDKNHLYDGIEIINKTSSTYDYTVEQILEYLNSINHWKKE